MTVSPEDPGPVPWTIIACARRMTAAGTHTRTCVCSRIENASLHSFYNPHQCFSVLCMSLHS